MNFPKFLISILLFSFFIQNEANAQSLSPCQNIKVLGSTEFYPITPLPQIRAADVLWHRRIWREIDLKEPINQLLYFPKEKEERNCCLYDILSQYIGKGLIKAYDPVDDSFTKELSISELRARTGDTLITTTDTGEVYSNFVDLDSRNVVKYWLKEDWIYDSKNSIIDVRIIGICPVKVKRDKDGMIQGYEQLFWLYFPHIRGVLVSHEAFKKETDDDSRVSYDDIFIKRMFNSYVLNKEGDQKLYVNKSKTDLDIKLESEQSKRYYFNSETKLWGN